MSQVSSLINALKSYLKVQSITYGELADRLNLTEATIKRMFSKQALSLKRLEQVCDACGTSIFSLMQMVEQDERSLKQLSLDQEKQLASDLSLILLATCVINRWTMSDIYQTYRFTSEELQRKLKILEQLGLIEVLPGGKIYSKVHRQFRWQKHGPMQRFFRKQVQDEFFTSHFEEDNGEMMIFLNGMLSKNSNAQIMRSMQRVAREFDELSKDDALQLPQDKIFGTSLVLAMRPWELKAFTDLRRQPLTKSFKKN